MYCCVCFMLFYRNTSSLNNPRSKMDSTKSQKSIMEKGLTNILLVCFAVFFVPLAFFIVVPIACVITFTRWCFSNIKKLYSKIFKGVVWGGKPIHLKRYDSRNLKYIKDDCLNQGYDSIIIQRSKRGRPKLLKSSIHN